jgi:hypothetical protein
LYELHAEPVRVPIQKAKIVPTVPLRKAAGSWMVKVPASSMAQTTKE